MVVLEAQACGLPAIVSNVGGPQEIVVEGTTGWVLSTDNPENWVKKIVEMVDLKKNDADKFREFREQIRGRFGNDRGWESVLDQMMGKETAPQMNPPNRKSGSVAGKRGVYLNSRPSGNREPAAV